ncbi:MAG: CMP/dCMP kinase [Thermodesulfobacteriota bacterium]|nr:CMP/dCMP kinase [Thermodesulfobacteriota bacterium]
MNEIITIDGPAGSGKSTVSRMLARCIHYSYLDTGAMYRAVALVAKRRGMDLHNGEALRKMCRSLDLWFDRGEDPPKLMLGEEDISGLIRSPELDMLSSSVSAVREVREAMSDLQRRMSKDGEFVAEGRDMGSVVFFRARWKFYLTASAEARVERRYRERLERGETVTREGVAEDLKRRDDQDRMRALSPLKPAEDAVIIDSTALSAEEVVEQMLNHIRERSNGSGISEYLNDKCLRGLK